MRTAVHACSAFAVGLFACTAEVAPLSDGGRPDVWSGPLDDSGAAPDATPDSDAGACDASWRVRRFPEPATMTVADFILGGSERLFLDVEIGGLGPAGPHIGVDVVDLASSAQSPYLRSDKGIVRMVAAGASRQAVLRYDDELLDGVSWIVDALTQGVWTGFLGLVTFESFGHRHGHAHDDFVALVIGTDPDWTTLTWKGPAPGDNPGSRGGVIRFEVDGPRTAALLHAFDTWTIEVFNGIALLDPLWSHVLPERPPERARAGPWLSGDTVLFRENARTYSYTLGDVEPVLVMDDPRCHPMDLLDGAALFGCGLQTDATVPTYDELRWRRGPDERRLSGIAGTVSEARLLASGEVVWREWDDPAVLCHGADAPSGRVKVVDPLTSDPPTTLGATQAPCLCCAQRTAPMRLLVASDVIAWSHGSPQSTSALPGVVVADRVCR